MAQDPDAPDGDASSRVRAASTDSASSQPPLDAAPQQRADIAQGFGVGDRLYGLNAPRRPTELNLEKARGQVLDPHASSEVTIDRTNNRLGLSMPDLMPYQYPQADSLAELPEGDQAFMRHLRAQDAVDHKSMVGRDKNARIRRASKQGIEHTHQQGGKVHFILDDINMDDVVDKRNYGPEPQKDITGSELRHIYRHRERYKDTVQFYQGGKPVQAPWASDPETWARYQPGVKKTPHSWPHIGDAASISSGGGARSRVSSIGSDVANVSPPRSRSPSIGPDVVDASPRSRAASIDSNGPPSPRPRSGSGNASDM